MTQIAEQDEFLDAREAATYAGKHINTIRRWIKVGHLPDRRVQPANHHYQILKSELDAAMQPRPQTEPIDDTV